jgi:hypothetical protein
MKRFLFIAALFISLSSPAQEPVKFDVILQKLGKIAQNKPVTTEFSFTNTGTRPLVIEVATAECGCTTPDYPKNAFTKGQSGKIKVTYNAEAVGAFVKKVNVKFANIDEPLILEVQGEVVANKN